MVGGTLIMNGDSVAVGHRQGWTVEDNGGGSQTSVDDG